MKRIMFAMLAVTALAASSGCCCLERWWCRPWGCGSGCGGGCNSGGWAGGGGGECCDSGCGGGGCGCNGGGSFAARPPRNSNGAFDDGPPGGQVAYPYYTNRGPRDFLVRNPQSIGP